MRRVMLLVALLTAPAFGNPEVAVDLPGGETMDFLWIEPGTFMMGSPAAEVEPDSDELPQHQVTISRGFWLGKYEVTQRQWESVTGTTPWSGRELVESDARHPAVYISWHDVQELVDTLNVSAGVDVYRLPTEAEWEYACRAGTTTRWWFGDSPVDLSEYAWYWNNTLRVGLEYAQPVGAKLPNPWGLHDMYGNVWEWCQDWYGDYASAEETDPTGPSSGRQRVLRGSGFGDYGGAGHARSAIRASFFPERGSSGRGVRLVRANGMLPPPTTGVESTSLGRIKHGHAE